MQESCSAGQTTDRDIGHHPRLAKELRDEATIAIHQPIIPHTSSLIAATMPLRVKSDFPTPAGTGTLWGLHTSVHPLG